MCEIDTVTSIFQHQLSSCFALTHCMTCYFCLATRFRTAPYSSLSKDMLPRIVAIQLEESRNQNLRSATNSQQYYIKFTFRIARANFGPRQQRSAFQLHARIQYSITRTTSYPTNHSTTILSSLSSGHNTKALTSILSLVSLPSYS